MKWILLLSVSLLLLTGALGLKTVKECDNVRDYPQISHRVQCYHTAAITAAYLGERNLAQSICSDIWLKFGYPLSEDEDLRKKARLVSNSCYYDIAKIARDPAICDFIRKDERAISTKLFGSEVSKQACKDETERLAKIAPWNYYKSENKDNICAVFFILPFLVFSVLCIKGGRP